MVKMVTSLFGWRTHPPGCNLLLLRNEFAHVTIEGKKLAFILEFLGINRKLWETIAWEVLNILDLGNTAYTSSQWQCLGRRKFYDSWYSLPCSFLSSNDSFTPQFITFQHDTYFLKCQQMLFILNMNIFLMCPRKENIILKRVQFVVLYTSSYNWVITMLFEVHPQIYPAGVQSKMRKWLITYF